jgi:glucuronokinase
MSGKPCAHGRAPARAALAGNPSDAYGGAVLAVTLELWSAQARATRADRLRVDPPSLLVETAVRRYAADLDPAALASEVCWESSIPRDVGLAGSSALVMATLRALAALGGVDAGPDSLAALALAVEADGLGIAGGPQDRVVQAYGGLVFMDFGYPGEVQRLDSALLPPLLVAWRPEASGHSGAVHDSLAHRHAAGEKLVHETMRRLAAAARRARTALKDRDHALLGRCIDDSFDLRAGMLDLDPRCVEMVSVARECGASANYTGSGGAIVVVSPDRCLLDAAERGLEEIGCRMARPEAPG